MLAFAFVNKRGLFLFLKLCDFFVIWEDGVLIFRNFLDPNKHQTILRTKSFSLHGFKQKLYGFTHK